MDLYPSSLIKERNINKHNQLERNGLLLHLIEGKEEFQPGEIPQPIQKLLNQYMGVFSDPKGLPPHRSHDHVFGVIAHFPKLKGYFSFVCFFV